MKIWTKITAAFLLLNGIFLFIACGGNAETAPTQTNTQPIKDVETNIQPDVLPPQMPNLQAEILDNRYQTTDDPIGNVDFTNFTYPFPRGWQDADAREFTLENGKRPTTAEKIGLSYTTTKFFDATGDDQDEAFVILKIETAGSAIPQIVYVFTMKDDEPKLIWHFRTGDRSDGGLKDIRPDGGDVIVELYGQDRYLIGEGETLKITGDEEQICCPTHFTRTRYRWDGGNFSLQGKRLTFSRQNPNEAPVENKSELIEKNASKR